MKAIDIRFLLMGIFFLLYGIVRKNIFIFLPYDGEKYGSLQCR